METDWSYSRWVELLWKQSAKSAGLVFLLTNNNNDKISIRKTQTRKDYNIFIWEDDLIMTCGLLYLPEHNAYMRLYIMYHLHLISKCKITSLFVMSCFWWSNENSWALIAWAYNYRDIQFSSLRKLPFFNASLSNIQTVRSTFKKLTHGKISVSCDFT